MEDTTGPAAADPEVTHRVEDGIARLVLTGELTDAARRPWSGW
ncbi:hypothetical protein [Blastococcus brunescens]|uniref:Uncharacterized protein n=1 Tax=Blastococcus brunescens TaxID=1564165 RepID=A0ABZ1AUC8_9ACTN|nr:hypothetical protein [Blastococcus sp. BMG 8361]WRL62054.1 hypothetical protein U6N30_18525 [Blastococcus sp. BMG 8361]